MMKQTQILATVKANVEALNTLFENYNPNSHEVFEENIASIINTSPFDTTRILNEIEELAMDQNIEVELPDLFQAALTNISHPNYLA